MQNASNRQDCASEGVPPNFRIWRNGGYGQPFVKNNGADQSPVVVYVGVSLMSSLFTKLASASYMMSETDQAYGNEGMPIVYLCGDALQKITEFHLQGRDKAENSVNTARKRWQQTYASAFSTLEKEGRTGNHVVAYWDQFTSHPKYAAIRGFVDIIMTPNTEVSTIEPLLRTTFPDVSSSVLTELYSDICKINIAPEVQANVDYFAASNKNLLEKQRRQKKQDYPVFYQALEAAYKLNKHASAPLSPYDNSDEKIEKDQKEEIEKATYQYLAEEFAVFLLLAFASNAQQIASEFKLKSKSGSAISLSDQKVTPVLVYPISASQNAENTFKVFAKVEQLYHQYAKQLDLPGIEQLLTIVDSVVPPSARLAKARSATISSDELNTAADNMSPNYASPVSTANSVNSSPSQNGEVVSEQARVDSQLPIMVGKDRSETPVGYLMPRPNKPGALTTSPALSDSPSRVSSVDHTLPNAGFFSNTPSKEEQQTQVEDITDKIFAIVEAQDCLSGDKKRTVFLSKIICTIVATQDAKNSQSEAEVCENSSEQEVQKKLLRIRGLIRGVVSTALVGKGGDQTEFTYSGYLYQLAAQHSTFSNQQQVQNVGVVSFSLFGGVR